MSKIITNCYSYVQNEVLTNAKYLFNSKMIKYYHGGEITAKVKRHYWLAWRKVYGEVSVTRYTQMLALIG